MSHYLLVMTYIWYNLFQVLLNQNIERHCHQALMWRLNKHKQIFNTARTTCCPLHPDATQCLECSPLTRLTSVGQEEKNLEGEGRSLSKINYSHRNRALPGRKQTNVKHSLSHPPTHQPTIPTHRPCPPTHPVYYTPTLITTGSSEVWQECPCLAHQ